MSDDNMDAPRKKRGRPPKIPLAPTDDESYAFVNEHLRRVIDTRTESRKLEPTTDILMIISEFAKWGATKRMIAAVLAVSQSSLEDFMIMSEPARNAYDRGIEYSLMRLTIGQMDLAKKQANMAIFLGKNKLGQKDEVTTNVKTNTGDVRDLTEDELMEIAKQGLKDARTARKMN